MSTKSKPLHAGNQIVDFYKKNLQDFGASSKGVGWKNDLAQNIRFEQLTKVIYKTDAFSVNDLGCGAGKYYDFLVSKGYAPLHYHGYDILGEMIATAREALPAKDSITLTKIMSAEEMTLADYTIASGIFNVKYEAAEHEWQQNILTTLKFMDEKSTSGFAFNLLTKYSDLEFMQRYLYYADPLFFFDYCKRNFSKNVALLHDYDQYDFTIIVRKQ